MPKTKEQKQKDLLATEENLKNAKSVVFTDNSQMDVNRVNELRSKLKESGAEMVVTKNSLLKKINKDIDLEGPTAVIYGFDGIVEPIKELYSFIKQYHLPVVKLGFLDGQVIGAQKVEQLSKLPSLEELRAKLLGSMMSPISGFVTVNREVYGSFTRVLNAIREGKE
ncbi:50S ribosomal protein L10 [bacterium]|nr:50S ribosomal protein L10 [bacterium]